MHISPANMHDPFIFIGQTRSIAVGHIYINML
jgi:hypothetical protein